MICNLSLPRYLLLVLLLAPWTVMLPACGGRGKNSDPPQQGADTKGTVTESKTQYPSEPSEASPKTDKVEKLLFTGMKLDLENKKFTFALVSMNPDGSNRTTLTRVPDMEFDPALSPDGKRIAFVASKMGDRTSDVCVMNADGSGRKTVVKGEGNRFAMSPAWSPDGTRIAYSVSQDGVIVIDADGKNAKVLGGGIVADWSRDGKKILYNVFRAGRESTVNVMDTDGKNAKELLDGIAMLGAYSPDGKRLVYVAGSDGPRSRPCIFIADADGKNARRLSQDEKAIDAYTRWSVDGRHIYFTRITEQDRPPGRATIHVMDADGKNVREVAKSQEMDMLAGQSATLWLMAPREPTPFPKANLPQAEKK